MLEFLPLNTKNSFSETFIQLQKLGKNIFMRRDVWPKNMAVGIKRIGSFNAPILSIKSQDALMPWLPNHEDLFAIDWILVKEYHKK